VSAQETAASVAHRRHLYAGMVVHHRHRKRYFIPPADGPSKRVFWLSGFQNGPGSWGSCGRSELLGASGPAVDASTPQLEGNRQLDMTDEEFRSAITRLNAAAQGYTPKLNYIMVVLVLDAILLGAAMIFAGNAEEGDWRQPERFQGAGLKANISDCECRTFDAYCERMSKRAILSSAEVLMPGTEEPARMNVSMPVTEGPARRGLRPALGCCDTSVREGRGDRRDPSAV